MMKIGGKEAKSLNKLGKLMCFLFVTAFFVSILNPNARALDISVSTPENPIIEISLSAAQLNLNLTPKADSPTFGTADLVTSVATNNLTGYVAYMSIVDSTLTRTQELESQPLNAPTIPSLAVKQEGYTQDNFTRNHWGYKLSSDTNYLAIPESLALSSSSEPTNGDPTTITFASKIDMSLPAGSYSTDINFVAVSNAPIPTLQDINTWKGSLTAGQTILARDDRDGQYYHVGKLADNRIWMLDNLALDLTNSTVLNNMTQLNTNASNTALSYLKNGGGTENDRYAIEEVSGTWGEINGVPVVDMQSKDIIPTDPPTNGTGYNKVGGYYNFCAASAGSYCYGTEAFSSGNPSSNATEDICPAGWRLPIGGDSGEYQILYAAANSDYSTFRTSLSLPFSGYANETDNNQGGFGGFWAANIFAEDSMGRLYIDDIQVDTAVYGYRYEGYSIRCIAKGAEATVTFDANDGEGTMSPQAISDSGSNLNANEFTYDGHVFAGWNTAANGSGTHYADGAQYQGPSATLYAQWAMDIRDFDASLCYEYANGYPAFAVDTRNDRIYSVQLDDNNVCWMTQNLILEADTELTYEDSAIGSYSSHYAIPDISLVSNGVDEAAVTYIYNENDEITNAIYNFCAVSAGSACYEEAQMAGTEDSICPLNWRLPTQQEAADMLMSPINAFITNDGGGYYSYGDYFYDTEAGYWWVDGTPPGALFFGPNENNLLTDFAYGNGAAIRCVRTD